MKTIYKRRSIRQYTDKKISIGDLEKLLKAGMNAPSAHNQKPYDFIVVTDKATLKKLSETGPYCSMLENATAAIVVVSVADKETTPYWQADCGAVVENILLEATELGIGSCWIGEYPVLEKSEKVKRILEVPTNYQVFATISLGYPLKEKQENDNYYPEKVHIGKF